MRRPREGLVRLRVFGQVAAAPLGGDVLFQLALVGLEVVVERRVGHRARPHGCGRRLARAREPGWAPGEARHAADCRLPLLAGIVCAASFVAAPRRGGEGRSEWQDGRRDSHVHGLRAGAAAATVARVPAGGRAVCGRGRGCGGGAHPAALAAAAAAPALLPRRTPDVGARVALVVVAVLVDRAGDLGRRRLSRCMLWCDRQSRTVASACSSREARKRSAGNGCPGPVWNARSTCRIAPSKAAALAARLSGTTAAMSSFACRFSCSTVRRSKSRSATAAIRSLAVCSSSLRSTSRGKKVAMMFSRDGLTSKGRAQPHTAALAVRMVVHRRQPSIDQTQTRSKGGDL